MAGLDLEEAEIDKAAMLKVESESLAQQQEESSGDEGGACAADVDEGGVHVDASVFAEEDLNDLDESDEDDS